MGRRIKSVLFSTDIAIIRNCNADAILAVYPFYTRQIISDAIINAASVPVLAGIGGGTTQGISCRADGKRCGGTGRLRVVVNAPMTNDNIAMINKVIDIPIVATVVSDKTDIDARIRAGVDILNVSAGKKHRSWCVISERIFQKYRLLLREVPTMIRFWKPFRRGQIQSAIRRRLAEIFADMMIRYRQMAEEKPEEHRYPEGDQIYPICWNFYKNI